MYIAIDILSYEELIAHKPVYIDNVAATACLVTYLSWIVDILSQNSQRFQLNADWILNSNCFSGYFVLESSMDRFLL